MKKKNEELKLELNKSLIGQLNRDNMSRIKGGIGEESEEDFESDDVGYGRSSKKRTRDVCGTSRSARICISLTSCHD